MRKDAIRTGRATDHPAQGRQTEKELKVEHFYSLSRRPTTVSGTSISWCLTNDVENFMSDAGPVLRHRIHHHIPIVFRNATLPKIVVEEETKYKNDYENVDWEAYGEELESCLLEKGWGEDACPIYDTRAVMEEMENTLIQISKRRIPRSKYIAKRTQTHMEEMRERVTRWIESADFVNEPFQIFRILRKAEGKREPDRTTCGESFPDEFARQIAEKTETIPDIHREELLEEIRRGIRNHKEITEGEVIKAARSMKVKKSTTGCIDSIIVKESLLHSKALVRIITKLASRLSQDISLDRPNEEMFRKEDLLSTVRPIPKGNSKFRPVSLIRTVVRLVESVYAERAANVQKDEDQYGCSGDLALNKLESMMYPILDGDDKNVCLTLGFDPMECFDRVHRRKCIRTSMREGLGTETVIFYMRYWESRELEVETSERQKRKSKKFPHTRGTVKGTSGSNPMFHLTTNPILRRMREILRDGDSLLKTSSVCMVTDDLTVALHGLPHAVIVAEKKIIHTFSRWAEWAGHEIHLGKCWRMWMKSNREVEEIELLEANDGRRPWRPETVKSAKVPGVTWEPDREYNIQM